MFSLRRPNGPTDDCLLIGNGGTAVLISVLAMAGTSLASTRREKDLIAWLARHDQRFLGNGGAGFNLSEMPWGADFDADKRFWLAVIDSAMTKAGWEVLGDINDENQIRYLKRLRELFDALTPAMVVEPYHHPRFEEQALHFKCTHHGVILYDLHLDNVALTSPGVCVVCHEFCASPSACSFEAA
jgi:hypothetical protein